MLNQLRLLLKIFSIHESFNCKRNVYYDGISKDVNKSLEDKNVAPRLVPIIPDEARTFGMEGFFKK